ncbi:hypothetical protein [Ralstonia pseudosolanacearum]|uniref:Uncharacterized protein n=1 Tax=Ralstonia solanacearum TaxID=305 RepID=A0AA92EHV6_RALSL|nr:hypothetical protein [Ralstonia pseudosolanacearum]QCX51531.1 hypothetical protein E7Z57_21100 [Ralstonia pseudosolanacearum]
MQGQLRAVALGCVVVGLLAACGGGDDSGSGSVAVSSGVASPADSASLGADCFAVPGMGKTATATASVVAPVTVNVATVTGLGAQTFEGQSYTALDVRNRIDQVLNSDQHHTLYMLPNAPYLPAGAITFPSAGDTDPQQRYAYTYAAMTLEQLRSAIVGGKATFSPLVVPTLQPVVPTIADFKLNTPVTLTMFEKRAGGTNPMGASFASNSVKELTLTYAGRESVTAGSTTYGQACRMNVSVRRTTPNFNVVPFSIETVGTATLWFAPNVGLVKLSMDGVDTAIVPAAN